jgi:hypothetical protein
MLTSLAAAISRSRSSLVQRMVIVESFISMSSFVNGLNTPSTKKDHITQKNPHPLFTGMRVASPGAAPVAAQMEDLDLADHLSIN